MFKCFNGCGRPHRPAGTTRLAPPGCGSRLRTAVPITPPTAAAPPVASVAPKESNAFYTSLDPACSGRLTGRRGRGGGSAVAVTVAAPASSAATCNGYVGITFDDGPTGNTSTLLNTLRSNGLRATMFNDRARTSRTTRRRSRPQVAAGMWIGNHSWNHPHMTQHEPGADAVRAVAAPSRQSSRHRHRARSCSARRTGRPTPPSSRSRRSSASPRSSGTWTRRTGTAPAVGAIVSANARLTNGQIILMHDRSSQHASPPSRRSWPGLASRNLCAGMISPSTGRAVAPDGATKPARPSARRPAVRRRRRPPPDPRRRRTRPPAGAAAAGSARPSAPGTTA